MFGIRRAGREDLEGLRGLWLALVEHHASLDPVWRLREGAAAGLRKALEAQLDGADAALFVGEEEGELLGFCGVRIDRAPPVLEERRRAEVADLWVEPSARRGGLGRALVEAATAWARERGAPRIEVRVVAGNAEGQGFWRALGYGAFVDVLHRRL
jgi:GNAT superfamily N-acetyltransferase